MKSFENNYLVDFEGQYNRRLQSKYKNSHDNTIMIIAAIEIIERTNRRIVWGLAEYTFAVLNITIWRFFRCPIENISIGKYQLKIEYLLDYINISYSKKRKKIFIDSKIKLLDLLRLLRLSNNINTMKFIIIKVFGLNEDACLDDGVLKDIALFYSRNIYLSETGINYYTVLKHLINSRLNTM